MASIRANIQREDEDDNPSDWGQFMRTAAIQTVLYPFEYAKVLMQIGFEPIRPRPTKTIFGKPAHALPNIFEYVGYIKSVDGFYGLYRGITPKLIGNAFTIVYSDRIADALKVEKVDDEEKEDATDKELYERFEKRLKRDLVVRTVSAIIYSPFHVVSVRMMAQFVGKETKYSTLVGSVKQIWQDEGVLGFFSGFIPRLLFDVTCVVTASTATYIVGRHLIHDKEGKMYFGSLAQFVITSVFYPLTVVSTCLCINGTGLSAGSPPAMPIYDGWRHCYNSLRFSGDHKRGSSLFFRYIKPKSVFLERM